MLKFSISKLLMIAAGMAVSIVAAWLAIRGTDLDQVRDGLSNVSWPLLIGAGVSVLIANLARAVRWGVLIGSVGRPSLYNLYSAIMIGYLANLALPLRAGDVARLAAIRRSSGLAPSPATATIIAERLLDVVTLAGVLAVVSIGVTLPKYLWPIIGAATLGSIVLLIGMVGAGVFSRSLRRLIVSRGSRYSNRTARIVVTLAAMFVRGLEPMSDKRVLAKALVMSFLVRLAEIASVMLAVASMGVDFPIQGSALFNSIVTLGLIIPSGPGAIGSFELLSIVVFTVYEIDRSMALSTAVVVHGMGLAVTVIAGTPMLLREIVFSTKREHSFADGKMPDGSIGQEIDSDSSDGAVV
jgi:uncharacterized protein (TIRG00374 family)